MIRLKHIIIGKLVAILLATQLLSGFPTQRGYFALEAQSSRINIAQLSQKISEPGGYFGSDNLVSNELSYQHIIPKLQDMGVSGGVYLGVGPDQSFTYIAAIKPSKAIMIDIRRDCLLHHLLFKALFMSARNRAEYLSLMFGRPVPAHLKDWNKKTLKELIEYIDRTPSDAKLFDKYRADIKQQINKFGFNLSDRDHEAIERIYQAFYQAGMEVRYVIRDRPMPSNRYFPSYRSILLETDLNNQQRNYLATEEGYQFLKKMQEQNLIIPVTGDLAGDHAVREIGKYLQETGEKVSAFYVSNVEFYLWRQSGSFERFVQNLKSLPINSKSVIIRSYFNYAYYAYQHPKTVENHFSVQQFQTIESLIKDMDPATGGYNSYYDLVTRHMVDY
ncbi:MAG: hypothetical protein JST84_01485 [Acidobacteria bacterium]|nr:hypothetical protein [Acidobacteriota bacterium]